jgi:hypothetical protein
MDTAIEPVGRGIGRDIASAAGEKAERQIDAFILHRLDKRVAAEGDREEEEAWKDTERRHIAARRERNRLRWIGEHYEGQAERLEATLGSLGDGYRQNAERLRGGEVA